MSYRNLTKVPKLALVYFAVDQTTSVVETKKLRTTDTKEPFKIKPARNTPATLTSGGKLLDAVVIAVDGKHTCMPFVDVALKFISRFYLFSHS